MRNFLVLFAALTFFGCSEDPEPSNNSASNNQTTAPTNNTMVPLNNVDNTGKEYRSSYTLRFDSMAFDAGSIAFGLNGILQQNFDQSLDYPIVVLVEVRAIDAVAGTGEIRGGSGLKTGTAEQYIWDPEGDDHYDDGTLVAATGRFEGVLETLMFVATFVTETDEQKMPIPIRQLEFQANLELSEDASTASISNGRIAGYLTKADGDIAQVQIVPGGTPISITNLFKETKLNYNSTTGEIVPEGEGDSWWLTAGFTAIPTTIVD